MSRCGCGANTCSCVSIAGCGITVTGSGSAAVPYTVAAKVDVAGTNQLTCGVNGLFVPAGSVEVGNTACIDLAGTGFTGDPILATPDLSVDVANGFECRADGIWTPGTLHSSAVAVGNVGPGVDTLASVSVPGNTLGATGDRLVFRAMLTLNATAENNGFVFSYGGTTFFSVPLAALVDANFVVEGEIIRTAAATQSSTVTGLKSIGPTIEIVRTNMAEDNTVLNIFLVTGESGGAGETNAVVLESLTIDVRPLS